MPNLNVAHVGNRILVPRSLDSYIRDLNNPDIISKQAALTSVWDKYLHAEDYEDRQKAGQALGRSRLCRYVNEARVAIRKAYDSLDRHLPSAAD